MITKKTQVDFRWGIAIFLMLAFAGCSTAHEAAPSGFLEDYSSLKQGTYFKQEYVAGGIDFAQYKAVKVTPVNFSYLDDKTACSTAELENLGRDFREDIENQLKKEGLTVTSDPSGKTLLISLAVTNIEPPDALLNVGLTAASVVLPVPLPFDKDGKTAFEGKITDGATGKVLVRFAEEREGAGDHMSLKAMTLGKYLKFTNTQAVFAGWAQSISKMSGDLMEGRELGARGQTASKSKAITKQIVGLAV